MKESKFLKKEDCGPGILVTIKDVRQENVAKEGAPEELKWCMHFAETEKPMVLNNTNAQIIAAVCGSEQTEDWVNSKIVLYNDPNITFQGKLVGGIRARAPKNKQPAIARQATPAPKPAPKPAPAPEPTPEELAAEADVQDDVPF